MNMKKIISIFAAAAMLSTATIANAAVEYTWDDENGIYWVSNAADVAERTPSIETTKVTKLTGDEVVALKSPAVTSFSGLKLSKNAGKYGDTATYSVYKVEGVFKNVGDLVMGYNESEDYSWVKLQNLDASIDCSAVADKIVDSSIHVATDPTTNVAWSGGMNKSTGIFGLMNQLGTDNMIPKSEGLVENTDYPFAVYFVVAASEGPITLSYSSANAVVGYNADGNLVPVKPSTKSFTLGEAPAPAKPVITGTDVSTDVTVTADNKGKVWNNVKIDDIELGTNYQVKFTDGSDSETFDLNLGEISGDISFAVILKTAKDLANIAMEIICDAAN